MHMKYVFHNKFSMIIFHDQKTLSLDFKSSSSQMFFKIGVFKKFAIFTEKHLWWIYYYKDNPTQMLSCEYSKTFKNTYFEEHLQTAASVLVIMKLVIQYWTSADLFTIKNLTRNSFY